MKLSVGPAESTSARPPFGVGATTVCQEGLRRGRRSGARQLRWSAAPPQLMRESVRWHLGRTVIVVAAAIIFAGSFPMPAAAQDFSPTPLSAPTGFPRDSLPQTASGFIPWLELRSSALTPAQAQLVREHLYALISETVKQRFTLTHSGNLPSGDSALAQLFTWAHRLGVPGAGAVATAVLPGSMNAAVPVPTDGFDLAFSAPAFSLAAREGRWLVRFPYYFMVGTLTHQHLNNGLDNDVAVLSTLTASNAAPIGGASQATILLASAQTTDLPSYAAFWLGLAGLALQDSMASPVPQAIRAFRKFDAATSIWKELVVFQIPSGSLVVVYSGLDGTYQANRPHYLDVVASLRVR